MASIFLDVQGAFDSVPINVLVKELHREGLPGGLCNFLYSLLVEKEMHFSYLDTRIVRRSSHGLLQGSCPSPLLYNFHTRKIDRTVAQNCTLRQLADDAVVSCSGSNITDMQESLQGTLDNLSTWSQELGIEFSTEKTEMVIFSRKHFQPDIPLHLRGRVINRSFAFKYLGVWFDSKCLWKKHTQYLLQKCRPRINFLRMLTGTRWGAHPTDLLRLYTTTIRSVLEYGSFCFQSAAETHILKLERVQFRSIRIALGLMHSTHTKSLEVLAGLLPLRERYKELALRYLIRCKALNHLVIQNMETLRNQNIESNLMTTYCKFQTFTINALPVTPGDRSYLDRPTIRFDTTMLQDIHGVPDQMKQVVAPGLFHNKFGHLPQESCFFTDGSEIENLVGFGVFNVSYSAFFRLSKPCSVYVAELAAISYALDLIESCHPGDFYIFTDSLSSLEAIRAVRDAKSLSYFLNKIRDKISALAAASRICFVWIPSHCSIKGNEEADTLAKKGALEGTVFDRQQTYAEFYTFARQEALTSWQNGWSRGDMGRWCHSIMPTVQTRAWFKGLDLSRDFIRMMSRLMSNHYMLSAHLYRIGLSAENICSCGQDYRDIEHVVWACPENRVVRSDFLKNLETRRIQPMIPVREILAKRDLQYMSLLYEYIKKGQIQV